MELRITIETVFDDGRTAEHNLGTWRRGAEHMHPEGIGLLLEDGHAMLAQIQKVAIEAQMEEISARCRPCPCCGKVRPIHDYRTRTLETLFGRMLVKAPRIKPCQCQVALQPNLRSNSTEMFENDSRVSSIQTPQPLWQFQSILRGRHGGARRGHACRVQPYRGKRATYRISFLDVKGCAPERRPLAQRQYQYPFHNRLIGIARASPCWRPANPPLLSSQYSSSRTTSGGLSNAMRIRRRLGDAHPTC